MRDNIIQIKNLTKKFSLEAGFFARKDNFVYAVNDVSFDIERGKTYGLVGESGCGKSTVAKIITGMYKPDSGSVTFKPLTEGAGDSDISRLCKYVFQDPARSLNPRMNVYSILTDGLRHSKNWPGKEKALELAREIIREIGLDESDLYRRPSEFSGGQRQRISIARGLLMQPELLICDEVVSALDVSIQGQILNLLQDLRKKRNLSFLFIAHDLRVSCYFCDKIGVMYRGVLVEEADASDLYKTSRHPYTQLLFAGSQGQSDNSSGEVKTVLSRLTGCPFAHRCPKADSICLEKLPDWKEIGEGHKLRCHKV